MSAKSILREQIKEYVDKADVKTLQIVHRILESSEFDPLANLSPEQEELFLLSLKQADEGIVIPHEEVKKEYQKWLTK